MLRWIAPALVVLAFLTASPATAHAPATDALPEATASSSFEEIACIPTCEVETERTHNNPPLVVVQNGTTVSWESADGGDHTVTSNPPQDTLEMVTTGQATPQPGACLDLDVWSLGDPAEATFKIEDGLLHAQDPNEPYDEEERDEPPWRVCQEATATLDGGWLLAYHCARHPQLQHGLVHVLAPGTIDA